MNKLKDLQIFSWTNFVDFTIIITATLLPFIYNGLSTFTSGDFPVYDKDVALKNMYTLYILSFRAIIPQVGYSQERAGLILFPYILALLGTWNYKELIAKSFAADINSTENGIYIFWFSYILLSYIYLFRIAFVKKKPTENKIAELEATLSESNESNKTLQGQVNTLSDTLAKKQKIIESFQQA